MAVTINKIVEEFDELSLEDKQEVKEILDKVYIEARREEIRKNGEEARLLHKEAKLESFDNADDVMKSLMAD